jgi:hypothetical protein
LPCLGPAADVGGNVGGSALYDRAHSVAELFFELAIREEFERRGYLVHVEYGFGGNLASHWRRDERVLFGGKHPIVEEIHEAIVYYENGRNPTVGKADFLLIPTDGRRRCGVIEVGTRRGAKLAQITDRVRKLRESVRRAQSRGKCKGVEWHPERWRPNWPSGMRASDPFGPEGFYICAEPTWSMPGGGAPAGILLYEVHALLRDRQGARLPVAPFHFQPLASEMSRWLLNQDGNRVTTLARDQPTALGHAAISGGALRAEMRRQVLLYGASAVVAGVAALLLAEMPGVNVVLIAATYKFVEAAATAAASPEG